MKVKEVIGILEGFMHDHGPDIQVCYDDTEFQCCAVEEIVYDNSDGCEGLVIR